MDFAFFERLSPAEAQEFLASFLREEREAVERMLESADRDGVRGDYSLSSVAPVFSWILDKIRTTPRIPDPSLPWWIRDSGGYARNPFDFDDPSKALVLRAALYLGESFVRAFDRLEWAIGDPETAEQQQPVVRGFVGRLEMAPILVAENMLRKALDGRITVEGIRRVVERWTEKVPLQVPR
jgi:hypothetical protein